MDTEKKKKFELLLGRPLEYAEQERLDTIKEVLEINDSDALWDILIALEWHRSFCERLPSEIQKKINDTIKKSSEDIDGNVLEINFDTKKRFIGKFSIFSVSHVTIVTLFLMGQLFYGAASMWAGYSLGIGNLQPLPTILLMPVGSLLGALLFPLAIYLGKTGLCDLSEGRKGWRNIIFAIVLFTAGILLIALY